ncbi:MAG: FGGY-family carbohydrate kinase, partial [Bacteroidota bacterium]
DPQSRVNTFAHVNHLAKAPRLGVLLCINGTGILNAWMKKNTGDLSYVEMNELAAAVPVGAEGVSILPFGNGAERVLNNRETGCHIAGLNFNRHGKGHLIRAAQEGIVFSLKYGLDIMQQTGIEPNVIRAGHANMFLSPIFRESLANLSNTVIELYNTDGAQGAARGAGIGAGLYDYNNAFTGLKVVDTIEPDASKKAALEAAYAKWESLLQTIS